MEEYVWLDTPIHKNLFRQFPFEEDESIMESIKITVDGSIMAVALSKIEKVYSEEKVGLVRMGYKEAPKFKVEDKSTFYKALAYSVTI